MKELNFRQAIGEAINEEMARDPRVFVIGEDVGKMGGLMGELSDAFATYGPERVRDTPLSEDAILGCAIGAAITGMVAIAQLRFVDFLGVCWDEILNQASKMRYMFGGKINVPVTITALSGAGRRSAAQHSQSLEGMMSAIPGLKIVLPSTSADAKGLFKSAVRDGNPVLYFEHKMLMWTGPKSPVPEGEFLIPIGKAEVKREGKDITVFTSGYLVHKALSVAEKLQKEKGISVEVIDPRTIKPLDKETILKSVMKTGRLVCFNEECATGGLAQQVAAIVADEAFDYLDAPIKRVTGPDTPIPYGQYLEDHWIPSEEKLIKAINEVLS